MHLIGSVSIGSGIACLANRVDVRAALHQALDDAQAPPKARLVQRLPAVLDTQDHHAVG